jgi:hypothetical protein
MTTLQNLARINNKRTAAEGMLITPPEMADPPVRRLSPPVSNRATTQDSLDVLNQQKLVDDYYIKKKYDLNSSEPYDKKVSIGKILDDDYNSFITMPYVSIPGPNTTPDNGRISVDAKAIKDLYRVNKNKNQLYQRESTSGMLDTRSPMPLYDKRIMPQLIKKYSNMDYEDNMFGDVVELVTYDPIAIKPISKMTPEERLERERKYPGTIPKPTPVKPKIDVPELLEPMAANYQFTERGMVDNRKPQMVSIPKPAQKTPPALQYPGMNQNFLEKLKSFITGKKEMPYWTDKQGDKHYPHLGESNPEEVKMIKMLKSGLNPLVPEDAAELRRINMLLKMNRQDRLANIRQ